MSEPTFDTWLREQLQQDTPPPDADFTARVLAALPPPQPARRPRARHRLRSAARAAEIGAMGLTLGALALLLGQEPASLGLEQGLAGLAALALLIGWSLPQSRLSLWR